EAGPLGRVLRDRPADILRAEDLAEDVVALVHVSRLRRQHVLEQRAAAELPEEPAETLGSARLGLRPLLEAAEDRRQERLHAGGRLLAVDAELARQGVESAHLGEEIADLHGPCSLVGAAGPTGAGAAGLAARPRGARRLRPG